MKIAFVDTNGVIMQSFTACSSYNDKELNYEFQQSIEHIDVEDQNKDNPEYVDMLNAHKTRKKNAIITLYSDKFVRMLSSIANESRGHYLMLGMDSKSWRKEIYPEYKGNRISTFTPFEKEILDEIFPITEQWIEKYTNLPIVRASRCEFDDLAFALASEWDDCKNIIHSTDTDLLQLYRYKGYTQIGFDGEQRKVPDGMTPERYAFVKSLHGDKGDNIPNVKKGLGMVKWAKKIDDGSLDTFLTDEGLMDAFLFNRKLIDLNYAPQDIKDVSVKAVREGLDRVKKIGRSSLAKSVFERTPFRPRKECINQFSICLSGLLNGK